MKIRYRNKHLGWVMEHNGVEAPYIVVLCNPVELPRKFNLFAMTDDDVVQVATCLSAEQCEEIAIQRELVEDR